MTARTLVIGNRTYSSWSLRAWLMLRHAGLTFEEVLVPLGRPETKAELLRWSPSGRVPVLIEGGRRIWETLAIGEHLAERHPEARLWPDDADARDHARCVANEMHAGFVTLRMAMPMNARAHKPGKGWEGVDRAKLAGDIARIRAIWREARAEFGANSADDDGFLFGRFSIADAMYAPIALRFSTYAVEGDDVADAYVRRILAMPAIGEWIEASRAEPMVMQDKEL